MTKFDRLREADAHLANAQRVFTQYPHPDRFPDLQARLAIAGYLQILATAACADKQTLSVTPTALVLKKAAEAVNMSQEVLGEITQPRIDHKGSKTKR